MVSYIMLLEFTVVAVVLAFTEKVIRLEILIRKMLDKILSRSI